MPEKDLFQIAIPDEPRIYRVVESVIWVAGKPPADKVLEPGDLGRTELSARYPRARGLLAANYGGSIIVARYTLGGGYSQRTHEEAIQAVEESERLREDPRLFDTEVNPALLPEDYQIGEGYAAWQARKLSLNRRPAAKNKKPPKRRGRGGRGSSGGGGGWLAVLGDVIGDIADNIDFDF